jgi:hypothetical protein
MEDHVQVHKKKWRYQPNEGVVKEIGRKLKTILGLPILGFLQYVDAVAWNEDVKYQKGLKRRQRSKKKKKARKRRTKLPNTGRVNTLLTLAHVVAADIGAVPITDVLGGLIIGRGVAPIGKARAIEAFPTLRPLQKP